MEISDLYQEMYRRRLCKDVEFRKKMYQVLCSGYFQKYIPEDATVLEIGAGYCEFINNIKAKRKIALDLNPDVKKFAGDDVEVAITNSTEMKQLKDGSIDVVFANNFFEHLSKKDIIKTVREVNRVLKWGGRFMILQPNIRFCFKDYWMFFDHITPLDDRSLSEVLEVNGFKVVECEPKFLPYTTKDKLPKSLFFLRLYLRLPLVHKIFGRQAFIYAKKVREYEANKKHFKKVKYVGVGLFLLSSLLNILFLPYGINILDEGGLLVYGAERVMERDILHTFYL